MMNQTSSSSTRSSSSSGAVQKQTNTKSKSVVLNEKPSPIIEEKAQVQVELNCAIQKAEKYDNELDQLKSILKNIEENIKNIDKKCWL